MMSKTIVFTDKSTSYVNIADYVEIHMSEKLNETTTKGTLKWVHIAISNAKRNFVGASIIKSRKSTCNYTSTSLFIN